MKKVLTLVAVLTLLVCVVAFGGVTVSAEFAEGDYTYTVENDGATIMGYSGAGGNIVIPSTMGGYPVTAIGDAAFGDCESLVSVTIPDSVTTIGNEAYISCVSMTSVIIGNGVTTIDDYAFAYCENLTSVTIGNRVTTIGPGAFGWCSSLASVTIPNSVTTIGSEAFKWCSSMTSLTIGNRVTSIGAETFAGCDSLSTVTIPNSVTTIDRGAFCYCTGLTSVTIPDSVATIGEYAFISCNSLANVYYSGSDVDREKIAIGDDNECLTNAIWHYSKSPVAQTTKPTTSSNSTISTQPTTTPTAPTTSTIQPTAPTTVPTTPDAPTLEELISLMGGSYQSGVVVVPAQDKQITFSAADLAQLAAKDLCLAVTGDGFRVDLDSKALTAVVAGAQSDVTLTLVTHNGENLNHGQKDALKGKNLALVVSVDMDNAHDFAGGKATVMLPFEEDGKNYAVYYLADEGTLEKVDSHTADGCLFFTTGHFSDYVVLEEANSSVSDVGGADGPEIVSVAIKLLPWALIGAAVIAGVVVTVIVLKKKKK